MADNTVDDGRLIRPPEFGKIPADVQEVWNDLGWRRPEILCTVCGKQAEGTEDHYFASGKNNHTYVAKIPMGEDYGG